MPAMSRSPDDENFDQIQNLERGLRLSRCDRFPRGRDSRDIVEGPDRQTPWIGTPWPDLSLILRSRATDFGAAKKRRVSPPPRRHNACQNIVWPARIPMTRSARKTIRKIANRTLAIEAAPAAISVKPSAPATSATMRKMRAHFSMVQPTNSARRFNLHLRGGFRASRAVPPATAEFCAPRHSR